MTSRPSPPPAGPWVQRWLSAPRHAVYLAAADDDIDRAWALYEWNSQLSAALHRDLAHLEIGLRNAYDAALSAHWTGAAHWTVAAHEVFAPLYRNRGGRRVDVNRQPRTILERAVETAGGNQAPPGKVIAELPFGFWRYLSSTAHEKASGCPSCIERFPAAPTAARSTGRSGACINSATVSPTTSRSYAPTWPDGSQTSPG